MRVTLLAAGLALLPALAAAQSVTVSECDWQASAQSIPEPWEAHTRTFSNGQTRLAMLDTVEPGVGWAWLLVLSPPLDELGLRQCRVIGSGNAGFAGMDFSSLTADYDPATGLSFSLFVDWFDPNAAASFPAALWFNLNQATGQIDAVLQFD